MTRYPKIVALGLGAASACGFQPLGWWPVTLIAVALWMVLVRDAPTGRAAFARGWLFGLGQFAVGLNWIAHAFDFQDAMPHWFGYGAVIALSLYLAVYPGVAAWLAWRVCPPSPYRGEGQARSARERGLPSRDGTPLSLAPFGRISLPPVGGGRFYLALTAAWIATEYLRATLFTGFAWNPLGVIWVGTFVADASQWIGTYGLSGLTVLACAGLIWFAAHLWHEIRNKPLTPVRIAALIAFFILPEVVAVAVLPLLFSSAPPAVREVGPVLRVVQPNLSLAQQRDAGSDDDNMAVLERLSGTPGPVPRLILWPEGAVNYYLDEEGWARRRLAKSLGPRDVLMTGGSVLLYNKAGDLVAARNSVFAVDARAGVAARYDKVHLVPYGEYLPMRPVLSAIGLARLVESEVDFIPGEGSLTKTVPGFGTVGFQLCYEIIFSGEVVERANRPDFIFNPSIDAWFGAWGPPQHLAQARLRAIEEGLPIVRSTTTGISAVIDAEGRLLAALPLNKAGVLSVRMPPAKPPTIFARYGNIIPLALALLLALAAIAPGIAGRYRRRT